jgi:predicted RNA-binding protein with TRAM domain
LSTILIEVKINSNKNGGVMMSYSGGYGRSNRGYGRDRGYGDNRRFNDGPKPVETGKEYDVSIEEISRKGDGIARVDGFVIFVKDGKAGQKAKVKITQVGQRFASAELIQNSPQSTTEPASE